MVSALERLSGRLKVVRKGAHLTQRQLAERANVSPEFISRLERGVTTPSLETLMRLCEALTCTPNDLLLKEQKDEAAALYDRLRASPGAVAHQAIHAAEAILAYGRDS